MYFVFPNDDGKGFVGPKKSPVSSLIQQGIVSPS